MNKTYRYQMVDTLTLCTGEPGSD